MPPMHPQLPTETLQVGSNKYIRTPRTSSTTTITMSAEASSSTAPIVAPSGMDPDQIRSSQGIQISPFHQHNMLTVLIPHRKVNEHSRMGGLPQERYCFLFRSRKNDSYGIVRMNIRTLSGDFDKTEDDMKALQSVGQIIGEILKQLDDERCTSLPCPSPPPTDLVQSSSKPRPGHDMLFPTVPRYQLQR